MSDIIHFISLYFTAGECNLTPPLFIEVPVPSQNNERSCICVWGIYVSLLRPCGSFSSIKMKNYHTVGADFPIRFRNCFDKFFLNFISSLFENTIKKK